MCNAKYTFMRKKKSNPQIGKKIFNNPTSNRGLISKIYKSLRSSTQGNQITLLKWDIELNGEISTEES